MKRLREMGIESVADLLLHVPRRYLDRSQLFDLSDVPLNEEVTIGGTVLSVRKRRLPRNRMMTDAQITDGTNVITGVWFNPYVKIVEGSEVALSGKVERFRGKLQIKNPDMARLDGGDDSLLIGRVVPIHPAAGGLPPSRIRTSLDNALRRSRPITEVLPAGMLARHRLVSRDKALGDIHFPDSQDDTGPARRRLVFDELFRLELALALRKRAQIDDATGIEHDITGAMVGTFVDALPYQLTGAQVRAIDEIQRDLAAPHPMHRLLQGEVGSGKTVVAVAALLTGVQSYYQGAVMAPTEVLAEQHYLGMRELLEDAGLAPHQFDPAGNAGTTSLFAENAERSEPGVRMALLTSNSAEVNFLPPGTAKRTEVLEWIRTAEVDLVVGTHALIQEGVEFARLGIAVVDEQHRFGVYQRVQLREKAEGYDPDMLIMTATPIPRTLSMTLYGDLDVSVLDEMPAGRHPVKTVHKTKSRTDLAQVYDLVRRETTSGHQAFVVCPLVEDSDVLEAASATAEYERLQGVFPDLKLGLIHGQLRPADKDGVMHRFRAGETDVLVATTVIEVGIDIPNATIMVIEDADRFGLSQLHQLRGRVGRGAHQSTCVLIAEPTTPEGEERIAAMLATTDGFRLAEEDLRIRGQGTVFGTRQAGSKDLKIADILRDIDVLVAARDEAFTLVAADPGLDEHPVVREEVRAFLGEDVDWLFRS